MSWEPDPACGCWCCKLGVPTVVSEAGDLARHLHVIGRASADRGVEVAGDEWTRLKSYLLKYRLPEWVETALLRWHVDRYMAEARFASVLVEHAAKDSGAAAARVAAMGTPPPMVLAQLRSELLDTREQYAQAMARHGKVTA